MLPNTSFQSYSWPKKSSSILTKLFDTLFHAPSHVVISFFLTLSPRNHFFISSTAHQKLLFKWLLKLTLLTKWITPLEGHEKPCLRMVASCEHFLLGGHSCVRKTANAAYSQRQKLVDCIILLWAILSVAMQIINSPTWPRVSNPNVLWS